MVVLRLLYFAHNVYLSVGDERAHKYFCHILIPGAMYVQPGYFEMIAETFNANDPYGWDMHRTASPWFSEPLEFEAHLFHLISRLVSMDYAKHYNARVQLLQEAELWHLPVCRQDSRPDFLVHNVWFARSRVCLLHATGYGARSRRYEHAPLTLLSQHLQWNI